MVCPYCHKEIPEDSIYCYHCGKELSNKQKHSSIKLKKNPHENKSSINQDVTRRYRDGYMKMQIELY